MKFAVAHDQDLRQVCRGLSQGARQGRELPAAAMWLIDNYSFLKGTARELREGLSPKFWRKLGDSPRVYRDARALVEQSNGKVDDARIREFFAEAQRERVYSLAELWALPLVLRLALLDRVRDVAAGGQFETKDVEEKLRLAITSLKTVERVRWKDAVESLSAVEAVLRRDPAGVYGRMDFETRDRYRHLVEKRAERERVSEVAVAEEVLNQARRDNRHVGFYLERDRSFPQWAYLGAIVAITAALLYWVAVLLAPAPWWVLAFLAVPLSQAALGILHPLITRFVHPSRLARMDFSDGVADDCKTFVVIPTLLLSSRGIENLLERIEIHYLASRDPQLLFGLLTDFADAPEKTAVKDTELLEQAVNGVRALNRRYGPGRGGPFFLFHREREWNPCEGVWMGPERKRGKLDAFNEFLLGRGDAFQTKVGDLSGIEGVRYVLTLDTDTQLPRDAARELIATLAHPLNAERYGLLQPRVSVSMESARRSRLAALYSGQTGLDPYTKAVSDVYQDLFGRASYTGKGIYDVAAFVKATEGRFPLNTLLSHDLIEGEHVRVGLVTDVEVIDDFPTTYESYSKRKHRWVRGDWQIAAWLLPQVPDANWKWGTNPLAAISRWKIFDNLRRSVFELSLFVFFALSLFGPRPAASAAAVAAILLFPAFAQAFFSLLRLPPARLWVSFVTDVWWQFVRALADALVQGVFLLHQAMLMADAIVRTLYRRLISHRRLLEWESAAQAEAGGGKRMSLPTIYLLACPIVVTLLSFVATRAGTGFQIPAVALMLLWACAPFTAEFLSHGAKRATESDPRDRQFLRDVALRTWGYFADFGGEEENWLVPDNVQEDPWAVAHRTSPTNMGLELVANTAAHDFGYTTLSEFGGRVTRILGTFERMERDKGHFYNWYDTCTLAPLPPRYVSSVDSGNLAACLITLRQSAAELMDRPVISGSYLQGLRDHCALLKQSLPAAGRSAPVMHQIEEICSHIEGRPESFFAWARLLTELRNQGSKLREHIDWLCDHWRSGHRESLAETSARMAAFTERIEAALEHVEGIAPWVRESRFERLVGDFGGIPALSGLPAVYDSIEKLGDERLGELLGPARMFAARLARQLRNIEETSARFFHEMDFGPMLDPDNMLMRIGYDAETGEPDESHYDLLASEARTAVFLAVAKGDFPREAWFRLGRKLTAYRGVRTLVSWSGTMFEYLMPALFLRTFENSLLGETIHGAVRIQQLYCGLLRMPWGVSEAAHSGRDASNNYQYRAFGIPPVGLKRMEDRDLVVAPYATALAAPFDARRATANLRSMADRGWLGEYGFYESIDYTGRHPVLVRAYMAHHQGMSLVALANAMLDNPMPRRFHSEPLVMATELLLQERLPAVFEIQGTAEGLNSETVLLTPQATERVAPAAPQSV